MTPIIALLLQVGVETPATVAVAPAAMVASPVMSAPLQAWTAAMPSEPGAPPDYPTCRGEWHTLTDRMAEYDSARVCREAIIRYQQITLPAYLPTIMSYLPNVDATRDAFKASNPPAALRKLMDIQVKTAHDRYKPANASGAGYGPGYAKYYEVLQRTKDDIAGLQADLTYIGQGG